MIGVYDFCGHYDWTFEWLREQGGADLVKAYWQEAISRDSQRHATALIAARGFDGMKEYWVPTLDHEAAGYIITAKENAFRVDMHDCPSKGFLLRNGLVHFADYCDHCLGWIGPMMSRAGFVVDHEHNHHGQCWWEMHRVGDATPPSAPGGLSAANDVRLRGDWPQEGMDVFARVTDPADKKRCDADQLPQGYSNFPEGDAILPKS